MECFIYLAISCFSLDRKSFCSRRLHTHFFFIVDYAGLFDPGNQPRKCIAALGNNSARSVRSYWSWTAFPAVVHGMFSEWTVITAPPAKHKRVPGGSWVKMRDTSDQQVRSQPFGPDFRQVHLFAAIAANSSTETIVIWRLFLISRPTRIMRYVLI